MQTAWFIAKTMGGSKMDLNDLRIEFLEKWQEKKVQEKEDSKYDNARGASHSPFGISIEEESAWSKARWFARMTMPVKIEKPLEGPSEQ